MSTAAATSSRVATYRKTKNGEWVVYGRAADLTTACRNGGQVPVLRRSGDTKHETIARVGRAFTVDGVEMAYGYTGQAARSSSRPRYERHERRCPTDGNCSSFGSGRSCGSPDCDGY